MVYSSLNIKIYAFLLFLSSSYIKFFGAQAYSSQSVNNISLIQVLGIIFFITVVLLNEILRKNFSFKIEQFLLLFFISVFISAMLNFNINTLLIFFFFFVNTLCLFLIFKDNGIKNFDSASSFSILLFVSLFSIAIISQFLIYGVDINGRNVGNFHPNRFSIQGLIILSLAFFSTKNNLFRLVFFAISIFLPLIVISRGGLFAILLFIFFYLFFKYIFILNIPKFLNYISFGFFFITPFLIILIYLFFNQLREVFVYLELIDSASRGLSSGFTGRSNLWDNAIAQFPLKPIFGYGFDNFGIKLHSSWLKILIETGLFGFTLFFISLFNLLINGIYILKHNYNDKLCVAISCVIALIFFGIIENLVFEISQSVSLLFFFFLSFIYYFLIESKKISFNE
tara:strand:- start:2297 stop:3487 length:1191 start_codon:yes stop_codon:yes gene_type:complete